MSELIDFFKSTIDSFKFMQLIYFYKLICVHSFGKSTNLHFGEGSAQSPQARFQTPHMSPTLIYYILNTVMFFSLLLLIFRYVITYYSGSCIRVYKSRR